MASAFGSSSTCLADFPPGLKAWYDKMKATKGAQAAMKVDLMPGKPFP